MITVKDKLSEGDFQKQVIAYLKSKNVWFIKYWAGGRYTKEGIPDIIALIDGHLHGIELKNDGTAYNETKLQAMNLAAINTQHGFGYVLRPTRLMDPKHTEFNYYCDTFEAWKARWFK